MSTAATPDLRAAFAGLLDDAAIFPPGNAPLSDALRAHHSHRRSWYAALVGPFVCSDTRLPDLLRALDDAGLDLPLRVSLTITGGAGAVEPALIWAERDERIRVAAVEAALRDEADLAHNATRLTTVLAGCLPDDAIAYVEMPRLHGSRVPAGWEAAADEVAASGHRLKYRTGGADADAFPSSDELAAVITSALDRELELKLTAGLHHAVRNVDGETGRFQHGFLNVLLATRAALDGADPPAVSEVLSRDDAAQVAADVAALGASRLASTRRWFASVGTCSIIEPVDDLARLGLIDEGEHA